MFGFPGASCSATSKRERGVRGYVSFKYRTFVAHTAAEIRTSKSDVNVMCSM